MFGSLTKSHGARIYRRCASLIQELRNTSKTDNVQELQDKLKALEQRILDMANLEEY